MLYMLTYRCYEHIKKWYNPGQISKKSCYYNYNIIIYLFFLVNNILLIGNTSQ